MSSILSVIDAMKASEGFIRPMREGEEVLNSGLVITVGVKSKENSIVHVQSLVLRTSGLASEHPYLVEIWIDLDLEYGSRILQEKSIECQCPAGRSEKCKHVIAVILYLSRVEEADLEDLSCTDIEQQWGALKTTTLKDYEAQKLTDLCHVKEKKDPYVALIPEVTEDMEKKWIDILSRCAPLSEYSVFYSGLRSGLGSAECEDDASSRASESKIIISRLIGFRSWHVLGYLVDLTNKEISSLSAELHDFYENYVKVTYERSIEIACLPQRSAEWFKQRKLRISASKARSQYTYAKNKSPNWQKRYEDLYHKSFRSVDTDDGLVYESVARNLYEEKTGLKVFESGFLVRSELPWLGASLDGTAIDSCGNFVRNIEVKTPKEGKRLTPLELLEMNAVRTIDKNGNLKTKNDHYGQMQIGMLLTGVEECDYLVYSVIGQDYIQINVPFNASIMKDLGSCLVHVYFDEFLPRMFHDHMLEQTD